MFNFQSLYITLFVDTNIIIYYYITIYIVDMKGFIIFIAIPTVYL